MSARKAFSDGWRNALLAAGADDLMRGTTLEHYSTMEPGGLLLALETPPSLLNVSPHACSNGCLAYSLAVRFWCLMLPDVLEETALFELQKMGCQLMRHEDALKLGGKPNSPKDTKYQYKLINASRDPCRCQYRYAGVSSHKFFQYSTNRSSQQEITSSLVHTMPLLDSMAGLVDNNVFARRFGIMCLTFQTTPSSMSTRQRRTQSDFILTQTRCSAR